MKITFLGTGAADWPEKRPEDMAEFRRMSSAIIDKTLLIDPGSQVLDALCEQGIDRGEVKYIINTHPHSDHFNKNTVAALQAAGAEFVEFNEGDEKQLGRYKIKAYQGNHSTCEKIVHFIISDGERTLFYGLDGAWLLYDEVQGIISSKPDLAVLDATIGDVPGDYRIFEHNNLDMVLEMKKTLNPYVKRFCISHMAMTLHTDGKTLAERMAAHDVVAAYDGLELEI